MRWSYSNNRSKSLYKLTESKLAWKLILDKKRNKIRFLGCCLFPSAWEVEVSENRCLVIWQLSCDSRKILLIALRMARHKLGTWTTEDIIKPLNYRSFQPDLLLYEIIKCFMFNYICYLQLKAPQHSSFIGGYILHSKLMSITQRGHHPWREQPDIYCLFISLVKLETILIPLFSVFFLSFKATSFLFPSTNDRS